MTDSLAQAIERAYRKTGVGVDPIADLAGAKPIGGLLCLAEDATMGLAREAEDILKRTFAENMAASGSPVVLDNMKLMYRPADNGYPDMFGTVMPPEHQKHPHVAITAYVSPGGN